MIDLKLLEKVDFIKFQQPDYFFLKSLDEKELLKIRDKWLNDLFRFECVLPPGRNVDFLFFRSLARADYSALVNSIVGEVDKDYNVVVASDYNKTKSYINFEISSLFTDNIYLLEFMIGERPLEKHCLYIRLVHYLYIIRKLFAYEPEVLVTFADMQPVENLAVQLFKLAGLKTVTLQHGLYVDYGAMDTVNIVNYKNHVADSFLAWGCNTHDLIKKYHPESKVYNCGKPQIFGLPAIKELPKTRQKASDILVVTDQKIFDDQNLAMLDAVCSLAEVIGCKVYVRFHPSNDKKLYKLKFPQLIELKFIKQNFLVVGHTTSMIYEAFTVGYPTMRYASDIPSLALKRENQFISKEELLGRIKSVADFEKFSGCQSMEKNEFIEATGERSLALYKKALIKIKKGK